jgi:hypothetical protein
MYTAQIVTGDLRPEGRLLRFDARCAVDGDALVGWALVLDGNGYSRVSADVEGLDGLGAGSHQNSPVSI